MNTTETLTDVFETNKMIAKFMGGEPSLSSLKPNYSQENIEKAGAFSLWKFPKDFFPTRNCDAIQGLCFHDDWNWLMAVVEKIRAIQLPTPSMIPVGVTIDNYGCTITDGCWNGSEIISNTESENPNIKELTYKTVVEFIEWYNEKFPKKV